MKNSDRFSPRLRRGQSLEPRLFIWYVESPRTNPAWPAARTGHSEQVRRAGGSHPTLYAQLCPSDRRQLAHAARNNDLQAARLMVAAGLPADAGSQHGATPLHWAAFHAMRNSLQYFCFSSRRWTSRTPIFTARQLAGRSTAQNMDGTAATATILPLLNSSCALAPNRPTTYQAPRDPTGISFSEGG